jgi:4-hydroxybenzoate polyprenyltransferase
MPKSTISQTAIWVLQSMRPRQWLKNLGLYAPLIFWGELFRPEGIVKVSKAVVLFCLVSSAVYLINDVVDAPRDRKHPFKKNRPITKGLLPVRAALGAAGVFLTIGLGGAFLLEPYFFFTTAVYFLLQILYCLWLRNVIILDTLTIALGFILRVFAGAWVLPVPLSSWLVLSTIGLALLLAFGKRRSERTILDVAGVSARTRETLEQYPDTLLDASISVSAAYAILSYSLFAFQTSPLPTTSLFEAILPATIARPKLMMLTIPLVIYAIVRYLYVIYEKKEGESPERILLSDYPLLASVLIWGLAVVAIIYWL